ncbi:hypothetical protein ACVMAJ_006873 [Bradyrhizobium sp. USDA 4448]
MHCWPMRKYYFHFEGSRPHTDEAGEFLKSDEAAWQAALHLVRDVENGLRPGEQWSLRVFSDDTSVFVLRMTTERCR